MLGLRGHWCFLEAIARKFWFKREVHLSGCQCHPFLSHRYDMLTLSFSVHLFLPFSNWTIPTYIPSHTVSFNCKLLKPLLNSIGQHVKFRAEQGQTALHRRHSVTIVSTCFETKKICSVGNHRLFIQLKSLQQFSGRSYMLTWRVFKNYVYFWNKVNQFM